ncbi:MAG: hypothetical protein HKO01_04355 [Flaviramulus sp.]|nr:NRDE family protein [Flaviramulus sp.]NNC49746.1 hypothetical protein [Flaviramulus sp.]
MCTVTIIPKNNNDFILTTNRDEAPIRKSLLPDFYIRENTKMLFPKDKMGGTWIGVSENNRVICVLNGGFVKHEHKSSYRKSRGIVANDFMISDNLKATVKNYNLDDIEPFTFVIADWNGSLKFHELVWDGSKKYFKELPLEPRMWSSSTLYSNTMQDERFKWFEGFKNDNNLDATSILKFHKTAGKGNDDYGVVMNRGFVKTTSITQVEKQNSIINMRYESLQDSSITSNSFHIPEKVNE